ncbi:ATP-binding protein [Streptomyces sp. NPDC056194]|uniref:ATP-binding protein n=1 Tax=unclassified Streptomyces TaxID=2593676 RepID=UPI0035DD3A4C
MGFAPSGLSHHRELDFQPGDTWACRQGLTCVRQALADWDLTGATEAAGDVALVAAELLSNAAKHAGGPLHLAVDHTGDLLRIAVTDSDPAPPRRDMHRPEGIGGHGVFLVEHLARQWGTRPDGSGKTVWADLALPPSPQARQQP